MGKIPELDPPSCFNRVVSDLGKPIGPRGGDLPTQRRYSRLVLNISLTISLVSVIPLLILTWFNYSQFQLSFDAQVLRPVGRVAEAATRGVESWLDGRCGALGAAVRDLPAADPEARTRDLEELLANLNRTFGDHLDLLLVEPGGRPLAAAGAPLPEQASVADEAWFRAARDGRPFVSEMSRDATRGLVYHVAVPCAGSDPPHVLRATLDGDALARRLNPFDRENAEAFLVNEAGLLQTPSLLFGEPLEPLGVSLPDVSSTVQVDEVPAAEGPPLIVGHVHVTGSPFHLLFVNHRPLPATWFGRRHNLVLFAGLSVILIMLVVMWGSRRIGARLLRSDVRRAAMYHHLEYTNKMAAIGRLGAGVAHEINNPLAIIGEKAGLVRDLLTIPEHPPTTEKLLGQIDTIQSSVERCSKITHRLLGFAKHMEVTKERIDLRHLLRQVLSFLDKEAGYRSITVDLDIPETLPAIFMDRGQLQQVFLNIINNAFAAVDEGGEIRITGEEIEGGFIVIHVEDDGVGISEEHLKHVFEPFYTTKAGTGTGLGLSITYGIVEKHGGSIQVRSKVGEGTRFSVRLPIEGEGRKGAQ